MDLPTVIFIAFCCLALGFGISSLINYLRTENIPIQESTPDSEGIDLTRIWRDPEKGNVLIELDGETFQSASDMNDGQRQRLSATVDDIHTWLGQPLSTPKTDPASSVPAPATAEQIISDNVASVSYSQNVPITPVVPAIPPGIEPSEPVSTPVKPQVSRPSLLNILARGLQADIPKVASVPKSIVAQVDEILQEKLKGSPLADRGIRLMELPDQGMVVMVGVNKYNGVDEVTDEEVKGIIRSAVDEWDRRAASQLTAAR
jgi:hypothetical protein